MKHPYRLFITVFLFLAFAKAQLQQGQCYFINAQAGLNLREGPSQQHEVVQKLPYGAQLKVVEIVTSTDRDYVIDNDKKRYGNWVKVVPTFWDYRWENKKQTYVFDAYLSKYLTDIPDHSLHNFIELYDNASHDDYTPILGVSSRREMWRTGKNCNIRFEHNPAAVKVLKHVIQFEKVDRADYINKKIIGNYEIDTSWQPQKFKLEHDYRPVEWEQYYLPINKGKDSVLIKDHTGEYASKTEYYGQIHELNAYLISGFAEDAEVFMVNKTTGTSSILSNGVPVISPQGEYLVSEYYNVFENATYFNVSQFNKDGIPKSYSILFSSWMTAGEFFWISENQFIMAVYPNSINSYDLIKNNQLPVTYLKGSIPF